MAEWEKEIENMHSKINQLSRFRIRFLHARDFIKYIEGIGQYARRFQEILLMGHFDNAFSEIMVEGYRHFSKGCSVRVISHRFNKGDEDDPNRRALESLADLGIEVKVNVDAHARMFIGNHENPYSAEVLLGSFDFNRDGMTRRKVNAGIQTGHPDVVREAVKLFDKVWENKRSIPLDEYIK